MKLDNKTELLHFSGILSVLLGVSVAVKFNLVLGLLLAIAGMSLQWHLMMWAVKDTKASKK